MVVSTCLRPCGLPTVSKAPAPCNNYWHSDVSMNVGWGFPKMRDTALFVVLINEKVHSPDPARRRAASILLDAIQTNAFDRKKRLRLEGNL